MIECTCSREKILTICDSKKINILNVGIYDTKKIFEEIIKKLWEYPNPKYEMKVE